MSATEEEDMNAGVAVFPPAHPWSQLPTTTCLNSTLSDAHAWILPVHDSPHPPREKMSAGEPSLDLQHLEAQMDFFHKLGYSTAQVRAIQHKFGPNTDTDKVLGELVRTDASKQAKQGLVTMMSVVLPRGEVQAAGPTLQLPVTVSAPQSREESGEDEDALRPIVIDGSNVAMSHGNKEVFSCLGIQLAVDFFLERGHTAVTVFVPSWRKEQPRPDVPITDQHILHDLERRKILVFTPSRRVAGKRVVCNDDCFIVKLGYESDGIIVSNDMYRDLQGEKPEWKRFIEERLLMYSFVNNKFMPPDDPLGRHGPTLENFLRRFPKTQKKHLCPYGKKCTYGIKCKFHHPERAQQSNRLVADELRENAKHASAAQKHPSACPSPVPGQSILLVEDMARKLTLGHESTSVKRDHKNEHVAQVKTSHRSSKKATSRKEKSGHHSNPEHISGRHGECQEKLDSGLGSIDSQPLEASWNLCDYQYGPTYRSGHHVHNVQQQCCLPQSTTCSCCSHGPPAFHPHGQHQSIGPISGHGAEMIPYGPVRYPSYGAYPVSVPPAFQHNRVHNHQQQTYWSDPFGVQSVPGERSQWESPQGGQPNREEREVVRKKLLAIFSAHLVDTAMERFPQVMDPQMLVAEILMLQSQNRSLR